MDEEHASASLVVSFDAPEVCSSDSSINVRFRSNIDVSVYLPRPFHEWSTDVVRYGDDRSPAAFAGIIQQGDSDLRRMNFTIENMNSQIATLHRCCEIIATTMQKLKSLNAPVHMLPNEILGSILSLIPWSSYDKTYPPALVCRQWRDVAFRYSMSSHIVCAIPTGKHHPSLEVWDYVQDRSNNISSKAMVFIGFPSFSGTLPISRDYFNGYSYRREDDDNNGNMSTPGVLVLRVPAPGQTLTFPLATGSSQSSADVAVDLIRVKKLVLLSVAPRPLYWWNTNDERFWSSHDLFSLSPDSTPYLTLPELTSVDVIGFQSVNRLRLPWYQLTELLFGCEDWKEVVPVLFLCSRLRSCTITFHESCDRSYMYGSTTATCFDLEHRETHASLETLSVSIGFCNILGDLFNRFALPALTSLFIHSPWTHDWPGASFKEFMASSPCLEILSLSSPQLSADELSCALHSTPLLTSLALHDLTSPHTADVSFLRKMVQFTIDGPILVPRLQHLSISADRYAWHPTAYIPAWIDMVEGRWRGPPDVVVPRSQLRIVEMRTRSAACWDYDDPHYKVRTACSLHDLERLRALAREGLEVYDLDFSGVRIDPMDLLPFEEKLDQKKGSNNDELSWEVMRSSHQLFKDSSPDKPEVSESDEDSYSGYGEDSYSEDSYSVHGEDCTNPDCDECEVEEDIDLKSDSEYEYQSDSSEDSLEYLDIGLESDYEDYESEDNSSSPLEKCRRSSLRELDESATEYMLGASAYSRFLHATNEIKSSCRSNSESASVSCRVGGELLQLPLHVPRFPPFPACEFAFPPEQEQYSDDRCCS
ncbi:hypothetical protein FISHEDRAFT_55591 [Fistulina hepatica ATCC 64428]|uniref:Uncharacterized protein n=1 Tax=Fistulina hepatica ATCC 64428 TaxID=1128425 RepID=A0A0D7AQ72_9AGAR|nr:hypothetical protein FISHEDRAFT_55591 [Fistulina hepatica ATCC 64428]